MRAAAPTIGVALIALAAALPATAQEYPEKTVRLVVPTAAGGSSDTVGRVIAERLRERLGQPVVVDNRPGAGQMIGAEHVAKSAPDGYTLIFLGGTYTTSAALRAKLPFDAVRDLTGVAKAGEGAFMLAVHPSLPVKSAKELVALARAKPGQLNYASAGTGSITHLVTELFGGMAKIQISHIPYKSGAPAATDLAGGHVEMMIGSLPLLMHHATSGRIRALAVTSAKRTSLAPNLPTVAETAVPGYEATQWWGMLAPAKTPAPVIGKLNREVNAILSTDEIRTRLAAEGAIPVQLSADAFSATVRKEIANWQKIVKELKIPLQ
jgi:tripartite-type tricarboxylate transporter receptor subunit TctC